LLVLDEMFDLRCGIDFLKVSHSLGFTLLWQQAREFLRTTFRALTLSTFTSQTFLDLTADGLKAVLEVCVR
jgi:hypothetical protein